MFSIVKAREKCLYNLVIANHMWYMFVYLCPLTYAKLFFFAAEFPNNLFGKSRVSLNLRWGLVTVWFPWMSQRIFGFCLPNRGHKRQKHASDGQVTHIDSHWRKHDDVMTHLISWDSVMTEQGGYVALEALRLSWHLSQHSQLQLNTTSTSEFLASAFNFSASVLTSEQARLSGDWDLSCF